MIKSPDMNIEERLERIERMILIGSKDALNASEVAIMLNISESRVRHLASERRLPHYKQGNKTYFRKSEIEDWMLSKRIPTNAEIDSLASSYISTRK